MQHRDTGNANIAAFVQRHIDTSIDAVTQLMWRRGSFLGSKSTYVGGFRPIKVLCIALRILEVLIGEIKTLLTLHLFHSIMSCY